VRRFPGDGFNWTLPASVPDCVLVLRFSVRALVAFAFMLFLTACGGSDGPTDRVERDPSVARVSFPRTAAIFYSQDELPAAETLAAYDVVVIDSEWAHRKPSRFFRDIRAAHPGIRLLAYVDLVDLPHALGDRESWSDRYKLWKFDDSGTSQFPKNWIAQTADGSLVSEYRDTDMVNLTDQGPLVDGKRFYEHAASWVVDTVWASGVWDGIYLDVWGDRIYQGKPDTWDIDRNGTDDANDDIYGPGKAWERGVNAAEIIMRRRMPTAILVGNNVRTFRNHQLDGRVWEDFVDERLGRDWNSDVKTYIDAAGDPMRRLPGMLITQNHASSDGARATDDLRRARFFLTSTLLQNGYWGAAGQDYGALPRYDELDGGGLGRGYLGAPIVESPTRRRMFDDYHAGAGRLNGGVFRRDFAKGIALVNPGDRPILVRLGGTFRHIKGTIDPATNDGSVATEVTVPARDGLILLRGAL
jgi:hypothetical protein